MDARPLITLVLGWVFLVAGCSGAPTPPSDSESAPGGGNGVAANRAHHDGGHDGDDDGDDDGQAGITSLLAPPGRTVAVGRWQVADTPVRATITGGPWTLGQGPATQTDPAADFPNPNPGTQRFQPYFWPQVFGNGDNLMGYFDYRPRNLAEAVVAARSDDGGRSWTFVQQALTFDPNPEPDPIKGNENGQGHPFVMQVGDQTLIYTLDRTPGVKDVGGLIVKPLTPTRAQPLNGAPAVEMPLEEVGPRTSGLLNPEGIIDRVPGEEGPCATILYLQRVLGSAGAVSDVTTARLASSCDGIAWTDLGPVTGLKDDGTDFLGARGSLLRDREGRYLLFYSGGVVEDKASDAYRFIGYAESTDLRNFTVVRGLNDPLLSTQTTEASGAPQSWWAGRVFGPSVTPAPDGRSATLMFAGFHTANASDDFSDYRQIGRVTLELAPSD